MAAASLKLLLVMRTPVKRNVFKIKNCEANILAVSKRFIESSSSSSTDVPEDPAFKYNSEFFCRHSLSKIAAKRKMLGLDPNPPDTFVPSVTEIEESTAEWHFVERLIPMKTIPTPPVQPYPTPTGWRPPAETPPDLPYYVRRNRHHLFNVFFDLSKDLMRKYTTLKYVDGDIWTLESDLRCYLEETVGDGKPIPSQVNETAGFVRFKGRDYSKEIVEWLMRVGF